jgi:hypothetical protein
VTFACFAPYFYVTTRTRRCGIRHTAHRQLTGKSRGMAGVAPALRTQLEGSPRFQAPLALPLGATPRAPWKTATLDHARPRVPALATA